MTLFDRGSLPALEAILHFTNARHAAIAHNIANVDTAGYKAVDAPEGEFRKALASAFRAQKGSPGGVFELPAGEGLRPVPGGLRVRLGESRDAGMLRHDGNNVDIDAEMARMVKNAQLHNLAASLLAQQFAQMRTAISERVA